MRNLFIMLLGVILIAGCSGGPGHSRSLPVTDLPPLSSLPPLAQLNNARHTSVEVVTVIPADAFSAKSENASISDSTLFLAADAGQLAWAVYGISGLAADYRPLRLDLFVVENTRPYYVALSDYVSDSWEIMPAPYTGDAQLEFTAGWGTYADGGNLYFAVLAWNEQLHYERAEFRLDDTRPLPAPTGLSAAPLSSAADLSWDLYPDGRADELRIYQSTDPGMGGATEVAKTGPGVTARQISGLTNGTTYYFALTAFMYADSLESPMSNIAQVTPDESGQLPAPTGLTATALNKAVQLDWDHYTTSGASDLYIYVSLNADMTGASEAAIVDVDAVTETITGLSNDQLYYFAMKAHSESPEEFSAYSNIVSAIPQAPSGGPLSGIWPRLGNREDNRGSTSAVGPNSFAAWNSVDLAPGRETVANRTSPVIDDDGNVYALAADGVLCSYSADFSVRNWVFDAADHGTEGTDYVCPPHSPCIDAGGNIYFIAAPASTSSGTPYLFSVNSGGGLNWRFDAGIVSDDLSAPYPTPNITDDGLVIAVIKEKHVIVAINGGEEEWVYELGEAECHADPALSGGRLQMPIYDGGIGIPETRLHWLSLDAASGEFEVDYRTFGTPANYFAGLPLAGSYFAYPELESMVLLDSSTGTMLDIDETHLDLSASPARTQNGGYIFQPHPPFGFAGTAYLYGFQVSQSEPPSLSEHFSLQLGQASVNGKPAVDGDGKIYLANSMGTLYLIEFDPGQPVGEGNPDIVDETELADSDTYWFNSFALGNGVAYIVTEQNTLYQIYSPED